MSASNISYEKLLKNLTEQEAYLEKTHRIKISEDSWYWEAITILKELIEVIKENKQFENTNDDPEFWNRVFTSLSLLLEMSGILEVVALLKDENLKIFLSKLQLTFKGPLLMNYENSDNNFGRNTMFELKLFSRLFKNNLPVKLHYDHPDVSFQVDVREYMIECKRIYKPETLVKNTHRALKQITDYSLKMPKPEGVYARYGIVAVSLSRYIHSGDKLFDAKSQEKAKERINYEMKRIFDEHKEELLRPFPVSVPALLLEYSDRGSIDMPYTYNFIDVHETANGRYSNFKYVIDDLAILDD